MLFVRTKIKLSFSGSFSKSNCFLLNRERNRRTLQFEFFVSRFYLESKTKQQANLQFKTSVNNSHIKLKRDLGMKAASPFKTLFLMIPIIHVKFCWIFAIHSFFNVNCRTFYFRNSL